MLKLKKKLKNKIFIICPHWTQNVSRNDLSTHSSVPTKTNQQLSKCVRLFTLSCKFRIFNALWLHFCFVSMFRISAIRHSVNTTKHIVTVNELLKTEKYWNEKITTFFRGPTSFEYSSELYVLCYVPLQSPMCRFKLIFQCLFFFSWWNNKNRHTHTNLFTTIFNAVIR